MRTHEKSRRIWAPLPRGFHISGEVPTFAVPFNVRRATYVRTKAYNRAREEEEKKGNGGGPSVPRSLFLFPIRDRVTWFWNLSKEPDFVISRAKIAAKSVCKVPADFPRFPLRFQASCYYLGNIDLTQSHSLLSCREFLESRAIFKRYGRTLKRLSPSTRVGEGKGRHTEASVFDNLR